MKNSFSTGALVAVSMMTFAACSTQDEAPKPAATPAPAAAARLLLRPKPRLQRKRLLRKPRLQSWQVMSVYWTLRRIIMILVTKEGKLVTIDFDAKYQPTQREYAPAKVADIGLGSAAVVQYTKEGEKSIASNIEFVPAKGE